MTRVAKVDLNKARGPLLIIAGEKDNIIPASLNKRNFKAYRKNTSVTDFKVYENRNHLTLNQTGWENVADDILSWLKGVSIIQSQTKKAEFV